MVAEVALPPARVGLRRATPAAAPALPEFLDKRATDTKALRNRALCRGPSFQRMNDTITKVLRVWFHAHDATRNGPYRQLQPALVGRIADAHALARRVLDLSRAQGEQGNQAWVLRFLGNIAMYRQPLDAVEAEAYYRASLTLAEELGMRPLQAHCHLGLGTLYAKLEQREQARAELSTAIALYRTMEMTFWLPQAEAALAQVAAR